MSDLEYLCHSHFYIVNKVNGAALAIDNYASEDGGMAAGQQINQYNRFGGEDQYNEGFKFSFLALDSTTFVITSKRNGQSLAVRDDMPNNIFAKPPIVQTPSIQSIGLLARTLGITYAEASSCLPTPQLQSYVWDIHEVSDGVFSLCNAVTDGYLSMPDSGNHNETPVVQLAELSELGHWEIRECGVSRYNAPSGVGDFKLAEDIRDNNYFKLAVPQPSDIPMVGGTADAKIDALGKMVGLFPDQNATEELYKALVKAMRQIVKEELVADNINDAISSLMGARQMLLESHAHMSPEDLYARMDQAATRYNEPIGDLLNPVNAKAGFPIFMQAATEQLAIYRQMALIDVPDNDALGTWRIKCESYHTHLRQTYDAALKDRLGLITKEKTFLISVTQPTYLSHDNYQPSAHNGKLMVPAKLDGFDTMYAWRVQQMTHEFNIEFGDVERVLALWSEGLQNVAA